VQARLIGSRLRRTSALPVLIGLILPPLGNGFSHRAPIGDSEQADDPVVKNDLLELASVCEEVASNIEDHLTGGWLVTQGAGCRLGSTYWLEA